MSLPYRILFVQKGVGFVKLKTLLFGKTYAFRDIKDVLAKANEEKSGDKLAGIAAENAAERVAAKVVLSELLLSDLRENPVVPTRRTRSPASFRTT